VLVEETQCLGIGFGLVQLEQNAKNCLPVERMLFGQPAPLVAVFAVE
jgi:hypothetical protein